MSVSDNEYERACYVCGRRREHVDWWSSRPCEYELDGKPSRHGLWDWDREDNVHCCPHRGYVSGDISIGDERVLRVVNSPPYLAMRSYEALPTMARTFLCAAILERADDSTRSAAQRAHWELQTAWACEAVEDLSGASACRMMAASSLIDSLAGGGSAYRQRGIEYVVI